MALEALRGDRGHMEDHLSYLTRTRDGKILKSSTIYIRDESGEAVGIFSINYDITMMLAMEEGLKQFTAAEQPAQGPEPIARNVSEVLEELMQAFSPQELCALPQEEKAGGADDQGG